MKKRTAWIACILVTVLFSGCITVNMPGNTYHVDYSGQKDAYTGARDTYQAGKKVTIYYSWKNIGTDTDYSFYLDGEKLSVLWEGGKGYRIEFEMPAHDVKLECRHENSMMALNPESNTVEPLYFERLVFSMNYMTAEDDVIEVVRTNNGVKLTRYLIGRHWDNAAESEIEDKEILRTLKGDEDLYEEIAQMAGEYGVSQWGGHYEPEMEVLDGEAFSFEAELSDGSIIEADGTNAFPDGYYDFYDELYMMLEYQ